jgi:uncharacterized protein (DUF983 family)
MASSDPSLIISVLKLKCPRCRKGNIFINKSVFPLGKCMDIHEHCEVCGQALKNKSNNGAGINYALSLIIFFLNLVWYIPIFGITYKDYSIFYYLITTIVIVFLIQPWLIRFSGAINLYLFIKYDREAIA